MPGTVCKNLFGEIRIWGNTQPLSHPARDTPPHMNLTLGFDIGHASIGWCALGADQPSPSTPSILGAGVVTFPTDDCLASNRRQLRRTRRHIRSTRQRVERLKCWLSHRGVLGRTDLDRPGHPAPFLLAAAALRGHRTLSAWELWTVLRWYAHNRGYDGNTRWASHSIEQTEAEADTKKELAARALMQLRGTQTMAETICACLGLDPAESGRRISSHLPYRTLDAAYPRRVVESEVGALLSKQMGSTPGLDAQTLRLVMTRDPLGVEDRALLVAAGIRIPKRYEGGLLFGQLVPRFDNRIIARCPITWATVYDREMTAGRNPQQAQKAAEREAKVPSARTVDFLRYRFARVLANIRAGGAPLPSTVRQALMRLGEERGRFTRTELRKEVEALTGTKETNLESFFNLHPDSESALVVDPAAAVPHTNRVIKALWQILPDPTKAHVLERWRRSLGVRVGDIVALATSQEPDRATEFATHAEKGAPKGKTSSVPAGVQDPLMRVIRPDYPNGRAPYARPVLKRVVEEVLAGFDPTKPLHSTEHPEGETKPQNGVLYQLHDPASRARALQNQRPLPKLTNNHLVRHRLLILGRLLDDIASEFCPDNQNQVTRVVVEVGRDLKEFSGMSAKEIASELKSRLRHFKTAVEHLRREAPGLPMSGGLIRKCRIAMDLGWTCPFTGSIYSAADLPHLEREHVVPFASRATNALYALVLTWPEVNRMKGKRTARGFIQEEQGHPVPGKPNLQLMTLARFDAYVEALDTKGHPDDARRKRARKALLAMADFNERDQGFTSGQLTQSSHLMKLALREVSRRFPLAHTDAIPGVVNAEIRKAWSLSGTLVRACPEVIDPACQTLLPKDQIRGITHLHHAVDAATLTLTAHYFPLQFRGVDVKGKIWEALLRRNKSEEDVRLLTGLKVVRRDSQGQMQLAAPPDTVKDQLAQRLCEWRVVQHVPADRRGAKAELLTWGICSHDGEGDSARITLHQQTSSVVDGRRVILLKEREERAGKLLGLKPKTGDGKLSRIKGVLIVGENYGLALDPEPTIIPFHSVHQALLELRSRNHGKPPRVLRPGMTIKLSGQGARNGLWRIYSVQASLKVDMTRPHIVGRPKNGPSVWREVPVRGLLMNGLEILPPRYTAHPALAT